MSNGERSYQVSITWRSQRPNGQFGATIIARIHYNASGRDRRFCLLRFLPTFRRSRYVLPQISIETAGNDHSQLLHSRL